MEATYQLKSVHLYEVLDAIGACEDIRWKFKNNATANEICDTLAVLHSDEPKSMYIFGSSCEGATTLGLRSDVDHMYAIETCPVFENVRDCSQYDLCYLLVTDATTKPGYGKLQIVRNGIQQQVLSMTTALLFDNIDQEGRICLKHFTAKGLVSKDTIRNGPSDTIPEEHGFIEADNVYAYRCGTIPKIANSWLSQPHTFDWPSREQVEHMGTLGCFFVGKGHPQSQQPSIEWRISFSLQERYLMLSLNPTQHKCYVLLKMIKNDIIQPRAGKSISSYHCKTSLFHTIENTESTFWVSKNLIQATRMCLRNLLQWTNDEICPNFFVPDENMFDRLNHETLEKVAYVLEDILSSRLGFLSWIKCDNVGSLFDNFTPTVSLDCVRNEHKAKLFDCLYLNNVGGIYCQRNDFFRRNIPYKNSPKGCLDGLGALLRLLQSTDTVTEHTKDEVRKALDPLVPHIHLQMAQTLASLMMLKTCSESSDLTSRLKYHIGQSKACDLMSSRLSTATRLLQSAMFTKCEEVLIQCAADLKPFVTTMCRCHDYPLGNSYTRLFDQFCKDNMSIEIYRRSCIIGCMVFLPSQACLVHPALRYEMFRSTFTEPNSRNATSENWFDWIVVDSKVFLFFLHYILYSKTNRPDLRQNALDNLFNVMDVTNLGHLDTFCNLLAWILFHENKINGALLFLAMSWRLRPNHNAAKWHLAVFYYEQYKQKSKSTCSVS